MSKVKPLYFKTYLQVIKNSVGANTYRNFYASVDGKETDILDDGDISCAFYVCAILYPFKLISDMHTTVSGTEKDLQESGWENVYSDTHGVDEAKEGDVIVWDKALQSDNKEHEHIGFYIGEGQAISSRDTEKTPISHPYDYREIKAIYRTKKLD